MERPYVIAVHGGAGALTPERLKAEGEDAYLDHLAKALEAGGDLLKRGGLALDAVQAAVVALEDCPLFNAGKGSVFTHEGTVENDAILMDGPTQGAGAVASLRGFKNTILCARRVLDGSSHVLLVGPGAAKFCRDQGLEEAPPDYFFTQKRWDQLQEAKLEGAIRLDHDGKFGTVGAVALDLDGNLAAGTSTGGMTNKRYGRVGDSPIPGSGTWADERVAVSCTGHGEFIMRTSLANTLAMRLALEETTLTAAANAVMRGDFARLGGQGGLISVDREGNVAMPYNTKGMFRGQLRQGHSPEVKIWRS